jgi:hypothetical protein
MAELKRPLTEEPPAGRDSSVQPLATEPASGGTGVAQAPGIMTRLLDQLNGREIVYCRWQGNEQPPAGTAAPQGLDILVERQDSMRAAAILAEAGFKRVVAATLYPDPSGEHHYLALEEDSGGIVRLHLRFNLAIGDERLREYRLPWERLVLSTRHLDQQARMYVADPSVEFLFLLVQVAFDLRLGSRVLHRLGAPWWCPPRLRELHRRLRGDAGPVADLCRRLLGAAAADLVSEIVAGEPSFIKVREFRRSAAPVVHNYRLYRRGGARWRRSWRELCVVARNLSRGLALSPRPEGRMVPSGGVAIAFLGSDGSGKSTLLVETMAWLSGSLRTVPIYFGSGAGPSSVLRWPLLQAERLLRKRMPSVRDRPWRRSTGPNSSLRDRLSRALWAAARVVWAVALAYEKRGKLHALTRARNRGLVVVCDRYPQNQFQDFNDGPMLGRWRDHPWRLLRAVAEWEGTPYRWAEHVVPDLVLKLHVRPDVAQRRKPDMQLQDLEKRAEAIRGLRFPDVTETVDIDAEEPLEQVVRRIRRCVWRKL